MQQILTKDSSNIDSSCISSSLSLIIYGYCAIEKTFIPEALKGIENRGHKNKGLVSYESFEILSKQVATLSDSSIKKGSPPKLMANFTYTPRPIFGHRASTSCRFITCWTCQLEKLWLAPIEIRHREVILSTLSKE